MLNATLAAATTALLALAGTPAWAQGIPSPTPAATPAARAKSAKPAGPASRAPRPTQKTRPPADGWNSRTALLDNDILVGAKAGAQFTSYSNTSLTGMGYAAGGSFYWNVGLPKLEAEVFVDTREQGSRLPFVYVGMPVLAKLRITGNRRVDWNAGAGLQIDLAVSGASTRRNVLVGLPFSTDLLIRLDPGPYIDLEVRWVYGLETYEGPQVAPRPRDLDVLIGFLFPIDREGF